MKTISFGIAALGWFALAASNGWCAADNSAPVHAGEIRSGDWAFTLTPRPFQHHPVLDMTALTEFTAAGKRLGAASVSHPIFYVAQDGGLLDTGETFAGEQRPSPDVVQNAVKRALASTGYKESSGRTARPKLALVYHYGSLNQVPEGLADPGQSALLWRARFIAGRGFANDLAHKLFLDAAVQGGTVPTLSLAPDVGPLGMPPDAAAFFSPVAIMRMFDSKADELLSQLGADCYYVAISAYDYDALAHNRRVLLWRTRLTVDATGMSMDESVPALIAGGSPYVGQPTPDVAVFARRIDRMGRVDVGAAHPVE